MRMTKKRRAAEAAAASKMFHRRSVASDSQLRATIRTARKSVIFWGNNDAPVMQARAAALIERCTAELARRKAERADQSVQTEGE